MVRLPWIELDLSSSMVQTPAELEEANKAMDIDSQFEAQGRNLLGRGLSEVVGIAGLVDRLAFPSSECRDGSVGGGDCRIANVLRVVQMETTTEV